MTKQRFFTAGFAIMAGCLINYAGDRILGNRLELVPLNDPLAIFNGLWAIQIFIIPVIVGFSTAAIFGLGGKWLCYFPPAIIRTLAYFETDNLNAIPEGMTLMPLGWWVFFVILAVESAAIGGAFGEAMIKKIYGRTTPEEAEKLYGKSGQNDSDTSSTNVSN